MSDVNTETIYAVANFYDLPLPKAVTDAEATYEAARALRDSITEETAPDLTTITVKTLKKTHDAAVAWENRDARLRAAVNLVTVAQEQFDMVKFQQAHALRQPLADLFTQYAADFMTEFTAMGGTTALTPGNGETYAKLCEAARNLDMLRNARAAFSPIGSRANVMHDRFELISRVFTIRSDGHPDSLNFHNAVEVEFWAAGVNRGHVIAWQDNPAQEQNNADCIANMAAAR